MRISLRMRMVNIVHSPLSHFGELLITRPAPLITQRLCGNVITTLTREKHNVRSSSIRLSPSPLVIPLLNEQMRVKNKAKHPGRSFERNSTLVHTLLSSLSAQQVSNGQRVRGGPAGRFSRPRNRRSTSKQSGPRNSAKPPTYHEHRARERPFPPTPNR